mmetsp:Transcript_8190/g.9539  ORF Transcript_8190/g.9539 Transcript_8190/m.9539 type:complete len:81 (+) Transcript_8190:42-284(+)
MFCLRLAPFPRKDNFQQQDIVDIISQELRSHQYGTFCVFFSTYKKIDNEESSSIICKGKDMGLDLLEMQKPTNYWCNNIF